MMALEWGWVGGWRGSFTFHLCILKKNKTIADSKNEKLALHLKFKLLNGGETGF